MKLFFLHWHYLTDENQGKSNKTLFFQALTDRKKVIIHEEYYCEP